MGDHKEAHSDQIESEKSPGLIKQNTSSLKKSKRFILTKNSKTGLLQQRLKQQAAAEGRRQKPGYFNVDGSTEEPNEEDDQTNESSSQENNLNISSSSGGDDDDDEDTQNEIMSSPMSKTIIPETSWTRTLSYIERQLILNVDFC